MKRVLLKCIVILLVLTLQMQFSVLAYAHSSSQQGIIISTFLDNDYYYGYYVGSESFGWMLNEGAHTNGTLIQYKFDADPNLSTTYIGYVNSAAAKWNGTVTIQNITPFPAEGTIKTYYQLDGSAARSVKISGSDGHLTSWSIEINRLYNSATAATIAHEFGHIIGLVDLYDSSNSDKLMYFSDSGSAADPTSSDIWGAKVISGQHTTHTFNGYRYHSTNGQGVNFHEKYCTFCNGISVNIESCTYNSHNICIYCGMMGGIAPW